MSETAGARSPAFRAALGHREFESIVSCQVTMPETLDWQQRPPARRHHWAMRSASTLSTSYPRLFRMAAAHAVRGSVHCSEVKDALPLLRQLDRNLTRRCSYLIYSQPVESLF